MLVINLELLHFYLPKVELYQIGSVKQTEKLIAMRFHCLYSSSILVAINEIAHSYCIMFHFKKTNSTFTDIPLFDCPNFEINLLVSVIYNEINFLPNRTCFSACFRVILFYRKKKKGKTTKPFK